MHDLDLDVPRFNGRTPLLVLLSLRRHRGLARRGGALGVADHLRVAHVYKLKELVAVEDRARRRFGRILA